ncbi:MAG TPA: hypothetical protein VGP92_07465, partial [Acidimicrobiia bacterium]|nr:hypothetical protein [Acidimicrobiia bacterium]
DPRRAFGALVSGCGRATAPTAPQCLYLELRRTGNDGFGTGRSGGRRRTNLWTQRAESERQECDVRERRIRKLRDNDNDNVNVNVNARHDHDDRVRPDRRQRTG